MATLASMVRQKKLPISRNVEIKTTVPAREELFLLRETKLAKELHLDHGELEIIALTDNEGFLIPILLFIHCVFFLGTVHS